MNNALHELLRRDIGIVIMLALNALFGERDGFLGAVLQAAQALDAVGTEGGLAVNKADITLGAELFALMAADARIGNGKLLGFADGKLGPYLALKLVEPHLGRGLFALFSGENALDELLCHALAALLRHGGRYGRQHELVREQPDA